ncbi:MAG: magnesium transporter [Hadesarchaea archaeon]|nr:magnesium transporter [Hadesarchaea archaeon]
MAREVDVRSIVVQGLSILFICTFVELGAGFTLKGMEERFALIPGLAIMALPLLDLRGNINGALASRLGTALHTGIIRPKLKLTAELKANLAASLILSLIASATIGGLSWLGGVVIGLGVNILQLMVVAVIAGFISGLILAFLTVLVAVFTYLYGWDPDNITSPAMATIGDFLTVICIYLAVLLVG